MEYDSVNLEILRMARQLIVNEYTDRRAEMHNKWLVESEHLWKTQRLRIAYPTIPSPPTEKDVIDKAQILLSFLAVKPSPKVEVVDSVKPVIAAVVVEPAILEPEVTVQVREPVEQIVEPAEQVTEPVQAAEPVIEETAAQPLGRILPSVIKKIEELRTTWTK